MCNACSVTPGLTFYSSPKNFKNFYLEGFQTTIKKFLENVCGEDNQPTIPLPGTNCVAYNKTKPLSVELLDSVTAHTKLRFYLLSIFYFY